MPKIVSSSLFRAIQITLLPFAAAGYLLWVAKLIRFSRNSGVSATVLASLYTRWMQHRLGTRKDDACDRLMMVLPNVPHISFRLVTGPTLLAHNITGYTPRIIDTLTRASLL